MTRSKAAAKADAEWRYRVTLPFVSTYYHKIYYTPPDRVSQLKTGSIRSWRKRVEQYMRLPRQ